MITSLSLGVGVAQAQPGMTEPQPVVPPVVKSAGPQSSMAFSLKAVRAVIGFLSVQGEFRLAPKISVAAFVGGGRVDIETEDEMTIQDVGVAEVGAQFRYYVFGDFDSGLHLGAQTNYVYIEVDDETTVGARGEGLAMGPFLGYKHTFGFGLTLEAQGGVAVAVLRGQQNGSGSVHEEGKIGPIVNAGVGYAF
jgi:hypothetical protein